MLSLNVYKKENNSTIIDTMEFNENELNRVSTISKKSFEVSEDVFNSLTSIGAEGITENGKFFINSYLLNIVTDEDKNFFAVSFEQAKKLRDTFKNIASQKLLEQAATLIDRFQPTKIKKA